MIKLKSLFFELYNENIGTGSTDIIDRLYAGINKHLKYCKKDAKNVWGSTHLDNGGKPAVRIDSKLKPTGVWVVVRPSTVNSGIDVVVKTIVNNPENNLVGMGGILFDEIIQALKNSVKRHPDVQYNLVINHNVNASFWKKMEVKYPDISFNYED